MGLNDVEIFGQRKKSVNNVHSGQRIITTAGTVRTIALVLPNGIVLAYDGKGWLEEITPRSDAWGGENDLNIGLELVA